MLLIKAGGGKSINWDGVCQDLADLQSSEPIILVHGASVLRDELASRLAIPVKRVMSPSGVASVYTDKEAIEVFLMAYAGLANKQLVANLQRRGVNAVGLCGVDGKLWQARAKKEILVSEGGKTKLLKDNLTGRVEEVNAPLIRLLLGQGYLPVLCAPAISFDGDIVNTDNDTAAAVMAGALRVKRMVYLFEAPGLLRDPDREDTLIPRIDKLKVGEFLPFARERMKRKIMGVMKAVEAGVDIIYFGDGRLEHPVRNALAGQGTVIG